MIILQVVTDTDRRGAQVFATDLERGLIELGHTVRTVALAPGQRKMRLPLDVLGRRARSIGTIRRLRRQMNGADVTVAHGSSTLLACAVAGFGQRRAFVYRQISDSRFWAASPLRRLRVSLYLRTPRRIVALSDDARSTLSDYLRVPGRKIDVVPNGVTRGLFGPASPEQRADSRREIGLPEDAFVAMYVGALVPEKGVDTAIESLVSLSDVTLVVVGDGSEREALETTASQRAPGRVLFLGERSDLLQTYQAADVVLLPSRGGDSMPATLIEAGFCGIPSISTPIGSIDEIVIDGETGLMVQPDDPSGLASAIELLRTDVDLRIRLGDAARTHCVSHFEISVVARSWEQVLEQAAGRG